jgi:CysZ protein
MDIYLGIKYNIKGLLFSLKSPKLLFLGILRFAVILLITFACIGLVLYWYDEVLKLIWEMPEPGFMLYLWKLVSWLMLIILAVVSMFIAYILAQLLFCVFIMDYMSRITEEMVSKQKSAPIQGSLITFAIHLIKQEIPRTIIPLIISFALMFISFFTPIAPVIIVLSSISAAIFLAWDNTDLLPARRMYNFKQRFAFLKQNLLFHMGFGLLFLIPWANILFLSFAPVGATLYYMDKEKSFGNNSPVSEKINSV